MKKQKLKSSVFKWWELTDIVSFQNNSQCALLRVHVVLFRPAFTYAWQRGGLEWYQCCLDYLTLFIGSFNLHHVKLILCAGVHTSLIDSVKNTPFSFRQFLKPVFAQQLQSVDVPFWDQAGVQSHRLQGWTSHPSQPPARLLIRTRQTVSGQYMHWVQ